MRTIATIVLIIASMMLGVTFGEEGNYALAQINLLIVMAICSYFTIRDKS